MDLNQFQKWADEKPSHKVTNGRCFTIKGAGGKPPDVTVGEWIEYRYVCQVNVRSIDEIDLEGRLEQEERKTLEELKKKYAG